MTLAPTSSVLAVRLVSDRPRAEPLCDATAGQDHAQHVQRHDTVPHASTGTSTPNQLYPARTRGAQWVLLSAKAARLFPHDGAVQMGSSVHHAHTPNMLVRGLKRPLRAQDSHEMSPAMGAALHTHAGTAVSSRWHATSHLLYPALHPRERRDLCRRLREGCSHIPRGPDSRVRPWRAVELRPRQRRRGAKRGTDSSSTSAH